MSKSEAIAGNAKYRLKFIPEALAEWNELDGSVKEPLRKQGYRLVYSVEDDALVVLVLAVDKREDLAAYHSALNRLLTPRN
ncbi:MAG: type II toxin-antitoxin system RelE family toxin [Rhodanobacter sp.]